MTYEENEITHPDLVAALVKSGQIIADEMTASEADLWHAATGIAGEAAEILQAFILPAGVDEIDVLNLVEEFGDMEFYLEQARQNLGITRDEILDSDEDFLISDCVFENAAVLAVAGGLFLDAAKKVAIYKKSVDREAMLKRFAHVELALHLLRSAFKIERDLTLRENIAKLSIRYGKTYSNEAAITRADKEEGQ